MYKSFISEHTSELVILPSLIKILSTHYSRITPIYYWSTMEGSSTSLNSFYKKKIKVVAFYPRRPKINLNDQGKIVVKINKVLFDRSHFLNTNGIPVIAGVPRAINLDQLHQETKCLWMHILVNGIEQILQFDVDKEIGPIKLDGIRLLNDKQILAIAEASKLLSWPEVVAIIKAMKRLDTSRSIFEIFGDKYKPVYLLLH